MSTYLPSFDLHHYQDTMESVKKETLALFPMNDHLAVLSTWTFFRHASAAQRWAILDGLLSLCDRSQLHALYDTIHSHLRSDFTTRLPAEICGKIFSYLDAQSLCTATTVCRRWKLYADDDLLWRRMCFQHIDKKCTKCGWALPLLQRHRVARPSLKRPLEDHDAGAEDSSKRIDRRPWKDVYSERLIIERNWRKNKSTTRTMASKHADSVMCIQFCERQNILISGGADKTVMVWNLETGGLLQTLKGHARAVQTLQFDHTKLITGAMDHTLRIWNYRTGECMRVLEGHTDGVLHLHFDSRILASASADATIKIWNFQTGECFTLAGHTGPVNHVQIYQHHTVISASSDQTVRAWDLETRTCTFVFRGHMADVQMAQPSMPGFPHRFTEAQKQGSAETPQIVSKAHDDSDLNYHEPSSDTDDDHTTPVIISSSLDKTMKIWSLQTGSCLRTLFDEHGVRTLVYDKLRLISGSENGMLKIWDMENGCTLHSLQSHAAPVTAVALSDTKIVSASKGGDIRVWDFGPL
ncbi:quinon protein alcohol dehydrogenase-like superfamily [Radiomyces spectabilis]|uniref:quinon protein alcohol dehydrogenase-like superfamily n=1 Tax=Radiomyces spectabilis TaxID=64574 RepID=UPI00221F0E63|nr:quinon protein alcohol dehydrogenase-like superfamily [Radiomyces spectabilis]KAI8378017.1 quinon protein alcohol dehydrogenase-like superfamily [Radiomyces spectabilis]